MKFGKIGAIVIGLVPFNVYGECTPAPDCASIGYTKTSCEGDSLKCPFDTSKLYCIPCDSSYKYTCDGTNEVGVGNSCGGKYVSCAISCDSSYKFSCDGPRDTGGVGESCNGLYKECSCNSESRWCDSSGCTLTVNLCSGGGD